MNYIKKIENCLKCRQKIYGEKDNDDKSEKLKSVLLCCSHSKHETYNKKNK